MSKYLALLGAVLIDSTNNVIKTGDSAATTRHGGSVIRGAKSIPPTAGDAALRVTLVACLFYAAFGAFLALRPRHLPLAVTLRNSELDAVAYTQGPGLAGALLVGTSVANALRLLQLPEGVKELLARGTLGMGHARALLGMGTGSELVTTAERIVPRGVRYSGPSSRVSLAAPRQ